MSVKRVISLITCIIGLTAPLPAVASPVYTVTLDTSPLVGLGDFSLDFQFIDGEGIGDGNNTVTLSSFDFGTGRAVGMPNTIGGVSGESSSSVRITDADFFNSFTQTFTPGSLLTFTLALTTRLDPGGIPDRLTFALLDASSVEVPSLGFADELLGIDLLVPLVIETYGSDLQRTDVRLDPPTVRSAPESARLLMIGTGILAASLTRFRARRINR